MSSFFELKYMYVADLWWLLLSNHLIKLKFQKGKEKALRTIGIKSTTPQQRTVKVSNETKPKSAPMEEVYQMEGDTTLLSNGVAVKFTRDKINKGKAELK